VKNSTKLIGVIVIIALSACVVYYFVKDVNPNPRYKAGQVIDSLNGVAVYYNAGVNEVYGENFSEDGYFIGLKYQCVEFCNRYYYQYYHFKMPDSHGNANEFFDKSVKDGELNARRGLLQFTNPSKSKPQAGDLVIFDKHPLGKYGHVAIVSEVNDKYVEIIQQNAGPFGRTRLKIPLVNKSHLFLEKKRKVIGWLRLK
jgi:surface antigen